jgi:CxxC motif-containing protein
MSTRELVCIVCPNGCRLEVELVEGETLQVGEVSGNLCDKGPGWAEQEILNPVRSIASSVLVRGGTFPLVSVKTDGPIPRGKIFEVMGEIKGLEVNAPVHIGDRLILGPGGTDCAIVATRNVPPAGPGASS